MFTFINPGKTLAPWMLALEQESYLSYIKKAIKNILQTTEPSHSSLDAIIGANKSAAIKKRSILQRLSTTRHIIDEQLINN